MSLGFAAAFNRRGVFGFDIIGIMKRIQNANYDYYDVPKLRNLRELIELRKDSDKTAFMYRMDGKIEKKSFKDFYHDVRDLARYFYEHYEGKNIAVVGENSYAWIVCALGIVLSGNVCVTLDKDAGTDSWKKQLRQTNVSAVYYSDNYCEKMLEIFRKCFPLEEWESYCREGRRYGNKSKVGTGAMIFFTSGTTGYGKAVVLSQRNIITDIWAASSIYSPNGRASSFLPYHHAFGFVTSLLMPYYYGCCTFISGSLKHLTDDFKAGRPDTIFAVPMVVETMYRQIWRTARREKRDKMLALAIKASNAMLKVGIDVREKFFRPVLDEFGGKLEYVICGGARLDVKYVKWFRGIGIEVLVGYGITECSPVVAVNRNHYRRDGSVGQLCRDVDVEIIDGEIVVGGDIVMEGYYRDKKATKEVLKDGYFYTGDLGKIDEDGFLFVTGRKKNLIILSNGENVSPEEIEKEFSHNKGVSEVMVYELSNRIVASVYPNEGYFGDQDYFDELIYGYNSDKPKNRQIAMIRVRSEAFPRNSNGKVLRDKVIEEDNYER